MLSNQIQPLSHNMENDILVIDNFLPYPYFQQIKQRVTDGFSFPWYYQNDITMENDDPNKPPNLSSYGFDHMVVRDEQIFSHETYLLLSGFFGSLLDTSKCSKVVRSRVDMTLYSPNKTKHVPHVDLFYPHIASVFYLTDSDAETVLYNKKTLDYGEFMSFSEDYLNNLEVKQKVEPKENRILIFDGSYIHTGHSPSKYKNRIIINTDLV